MGRIGTWTKRVPSYRSAQSSPAVRGLAPYPVADPFGATIALSPKPSTFTVAVELMVVGGRNEMINPVGYEVVAGVVPQKNFGRVPEPIHRFPCVASGPNAIG